MGVFSICVNIAENFKCWFTYIIAIHNLFFVVPTHTPNKPLTKINSTWCSIKDTMNKVPWALDKHDFVNRCRVQGSLGRRRPGSLKPSSTSCGGLVGIYRQKPTGKFVRKEQIGLAPSDFKNLFATKNLCFCMG